MCSKSYKTFAPVIPLWETLCAKEANQNSKGGRAGKQNLHEDMHSSFITAITWKQPNCFIYGGTGAIKGEGHTTRKYMATKSDKSVNYITSKMEIYSENKYK